LVAKSVSPLYLWVKTGKVIATGIAITKTDTLIIILSISNKYKNPKTTKGINNSLSKDNRYIDLDLNKSLNFILDKMPPIINIESGIVIKPNDVMLLSIKYGNLIWNR